MKQIAAAVKIIAIFFISTSSFVRRYHIRRS